jgi:alanine racemase
MSVWQLNDSHDIAIIEAGISRPDEMHNLKKIIKPTIGIFTNIGQAHGKNFDNIDDKIEEKLKLFSDVQTLIYCLDYKGIDDKVKKLNVNTFTWSRNDESADVKICSVAKGKDNTTIEAIVKSQRTTMKIVIPFVDDA